MSEEWRPVHHRPAYEVSNHGRVRIKKNGKIKKLQKHRGGWKGGGCVYLRVDLGVVEGTKNNKRHKHFVHRLVAEAFLVKHPDQTEVDHVNGDAQDNRLENLEWVTGSENRRRRDNRLENLEWVTGSENRRRRDKRMEADDSDTDEGNTDFNPKDLE